MLWSPFYSPQEIDIIQHAQMSLSVQCEKLSSVGNCEMVIYLKVNGKRKVNLFYL